MSDIASWVHDAVKRRVMELDESDYQYDDIERECWQRLVSDPRMIDVYGGKYLSQKLTAQGWRIWFDIATHLEVSLGIGTTGSQVPYRSLNRIHAISTPAAAQAVIRLPLSLSRRYHLPTVSTTSLHHYDASSMVHLRSSLRSLPDGVHLRLLTSTLTTRALYPRSLRWFVTCACTPITRVLPSSSIKHRIGNFYALLRS